MNGTDQRLHRKATDALHDRLNSVETVLPAIDQRVTHVVDGIVTSIARLEKADDRLATRLEWFEQLTWWGRLRWLVRGR